MHIGIISRWLQALGHRAAWVCQYQAAAVNYFDRDFEPTV
jgi:hypothetical protein